MQPPVGWNALRRVRVSQTRPQRGVALHMLKDVFLVQQARTRVSRGVMLSPTGRSG